MPAPPRRPVLFAGIAFAIVVVLLLGHHQYDRDAYAAYTPSWMSKTPKAPEQLNAGTASRIAHLREECSRPDEFEEQFGRTNLRMTRGYEERFINKVLRGEPVKVGVLGGSVTAGHGVYDSERWPGHMNDFLNKFFQPEGGDIPVTNGAAAASGSDYFSFCFALHIPLDVDLVFIELGVNDEGDLEHVNNMELLLRGLLDLEKQPAVVLLEAMAFSGGGMGGGGGRFHLPVAQYYDVPVINQRHILASHFGRFPDLVPHVFARDYWGNPDMRHLNARGHMDAMKLLASLIRDTTCAMVSDPNFQIAADEPETAVLEVTKDDSYDALVEKLYEPDVQTALQTLEADWAKEEKTWEMKYQPPKKKEGDDTPEPEHKDSYLQPGLYNRRVENGLVPRMPILNGWNPDPAYRFPTFQPTCYSTKAKEARYNLTPSWTDGWEWWQREDHWDKPYIMAHEPGARVTFDIATQAGTVKVYYQRSKSQSLGKIRCWMDDEEKEGKPGVLMNGYWTKGHLNIGRYATVAENLKPGKHQLHCLNLNETDAEDGKHDFKLISIVSN